MVSVGQDSLLPFERQRKAKKSFKKWICSFFSVVKRPLYRNRQTPCDRHQVWGCSRHRQNPHSFVERQNLRTPKLAALGDKNSNPQCPWPSCGQHETEFRLNGVSVGENDENATKKIQTWTRIHASFANSIGFGQRGWNQKQSNENNIFHFFKKWGKGFCSQHKENLVAKHVLFFAWISLLQNTAK